MAAARERALLALFRASYSITARDSAIAKASSTNRENRAFVTKSCTNVWQTGQIWAVFGIVQGPSKMEKGERACPLFFSKKWKMGLKKAKFSKIIEKDEKKRKYARKRAKMRCFWPKKG